MDLTLDQIAPWPCNACGDEELTLAAYYPDKGCVLGRRKTCIACVLEKQTGQRARRGPDYDRDAKRRRNFKLTPEGFNSLFASQGNRCAICRRADTGTVRAWHVDHDHACCPEPGKSCGACIRGILCHGCNLVLGHSKDDAALLRAAAEYLDGA